MKTDFTKILINANGIDPDDFKRWVFCAGMTFNAPGKWWGDHGKRDFPHEGIDLCLYVDGNGRFHRLDEQIRIPAMHDGTVKAMFKDYLGQAVVIEHAGAEGEDGKFLSAYAHTAPRPGIKPGVMVQRGDIIATIADTRGSRAKILPHLHYSLGRPSPNIDYNQFVWDIMRDADLITLLDPVDLLDWPARVLASQERRCLERLGLKAW